LLALVALILAVIPMAGILGLKPVSIAIANSLWICALVLTVVALLMSVRQGLKTRG